MKAPWFMALASLLMALMSEVHGADRISLQLKWFPQAQFAGYYAAQEKGFFSQEGIELKILPGGTDSAGQPIVPEEVVSSGKAELGIDWLPSLLTFRGQGHALVNIAQIFQFSGLREVALRSSGISSAADLRGRKVAVFMEGNEDELLATLDKYGIDPRTDLTLIPQPFADGHLLLFNGGADAVSATTYNEYKLILDAGAKPEDLTVIDFNQEGTAMLEDGVFANEAWLRDPKNKDVAARFLRASLQGWRYCRDFPDECVDIVLRKASGADREHQSWMMTEINKLIWGPPAPTVELGFMDPGAFERTASIALRFGVIRQPPDRGAYTHEIWMQAQR